MQRKAFELPDNECERLTRNEMAALRMVLILTSELSYAKDDLAKRLELIPDGTTRMNDSLENVLGLFQDLIGTVTDKQRKTLKNSAMDYEVRLVPKLSPESSSLAVSKTDLTNLIDCARERCKFCTLDGTDAAKCDLYKILETIVPLDDYSMDIACPYAFTEWIK